jgi:hypothetical protein
VPTDEELLAIKDRANEQLKRISGVTGVGIGGRVRGGERIQELVLKVYVEAKRPAGQLEPSELVPAEFEGIPTDVSEMPAGGRLLLGPPPLGKPESVPVDERELRPLQGGLRIEVDDSGGPWGTLGCMMVGIADPLKAYALTNWHVLVANQGTPPSVRKVPPVVGTTKAGQPTDRDSSCECCSSIIGKVAGGGSDGIRDAGVVKLAPGIEWQADIVEIGAIHGSHPITPTEAGTHPAVRKRGARTGLTGGTIDSVGFPALVDGKSFGNTMVVQPNADPSLPAETPVFFNHHGDSGSALVNDENKVIGLVYAMPLPAGPPNPGYHGLVSGWVLPINDILGSFPAHENFALRVADAAVPGKINKVPGAAMAAVPREIAPVLLGDRIGAEAEGPVRVPVAGIGLEPPPATALARLQQRLDRSERGQSLRALWLSHQAELLDLVGSNKRVATVWHRSGASALFGVLVRMLSQPQLTLPPTLNGEPLSACIDRVCAIFGRFGSAELQRDMAQVRDGLPELGGLDFDGVCRALEAG